MCGIKIKRPMAALGSVVTVSTERSTSIGLTARNGIVQKAPKIGFASLPGLRWAPGLGEDIPLA
jgi:hypothetical protein